MQITGDVKIAGAFIKARAQIGGTVGKDAKGNYGRYATLAAITEAISSALADNGLAFVQECFTDESGVTVHTTLIHETGATMEFAPLSLPVERKNAQGVGSAITYARRYQLSAICGLAPEDDDGTEATRTPGAGRMTSGSVNGGAGVCKVCRAPAGKPHASNCTAVESQPAVTNLADVGELPFDGASTATEEFNAIPSAPPATNGNGHKSNGTAKQAAQAQSDKPAELPDNLRKKLHAVGTQAYGEEWNTKRPELVKAITKGRSESSNDLTIDEANRMISGMEKRISATVPA